MTDNDKEHSYVEMENFITAINSKVIALPDEDTKRNNVILKEVTDKLVEKMRQSCPLFNTLYQRNFYGGSYYDNLKVGHPNEFDLDLVMVLPKQIEPDVRTTDIPGFVMVKINGYLKALEEPKATVEKFEKIDKLLDLSKVHLSTTNVLKWMEGIVNKSLNEMSRDDEAKQTYIDMVLNRVNPKDVTRIWINLVKTGPAFTLKLSSPTNSKINLDIDLVPCFQFSSKHWPSQNSGYTQNPCPNKLNFLVVPKKPKTEGLSSQLIERYWRLSFQEQERELIGGDKKKAFKPSLRLMKMLKEYEMCMRNQFIPYYWNKKFNLIGNMNAATMNSIAGRLKNIIEDVERKLRDPIDHFVLEKYLLITLSEAEINGLKQNVTLTKNQKKRLEATNNIVTVSEASSVVDELDSSFETPIEQFRFSERTVEDCINNLIQLDKKCKDRYEQIMAQIKERYLKREFQFEKQVLIYLEKIDGKLDALVEKVDQNVNETAELRSKITILEDKLAKLQIGNKSVEALENGLNLL